MTAKDKMAMQLQKTNGNMPQAHQPVKTIADYIKAMTPEIAKALPSHMRPERLARIVTTEIRRNPKLMECTRESLLGALMLSAQLGLEPGPLGHCYYIPFANRKTGVTDCQFLLGYRGMIDLARRSGNIESIMAETVYENDVFEFEYGLNPNLIHKPNLQERGKSIAWYAVAKFKDGGYQMKVMGKGDIEKARSRSMTGKSQYSPWATDYDEMAKKGLSIATPIPTPDGWTTMGEIQVGDTVFDMNGEQTTVIAVSEIKNIPCFRVNFTNGDSIICDDEHRWVARMGGANACRKEYTTETVNDLYDALQDGLSVTIPIQKPLDIHEKNLEIDPYLLGYWLGDGHSQASVITCGSYDKGYLCEAINKSKYKLGSVRQDERTGAFSIGIKNGFWNSLKKLNLIKNKHVPSAYLRGSISQRRALLQGLMDSDGHIDKARGRAHFHNTNINLSDAVAELAYSLGEVVHRATKRQHGFGKDCVSHAVFWQPTFCCVRNPRHRENYTPRKITPYRAIQNIERISSVPTKCIAVDSDTSTYLAGKSMAVTHNTVVRAMFKYLPVSNEIMRYSEKDAVIKKDISEDEGEIYIDIEPQQTTQITVSDAPEQPTIEMPAALMDLHRDFPEEFRMALQQLNIDTITDEHVEPIKKRVNMILDEQQAAEMMPE